MAVRRVSWARAWRVIAARYPPIDLFEGLTDDPGVWDALIELEQLTNPRIRDEVGAIQLVAPEDRIAGPGSSFVMAAFTHLNPKGSRFSDGSYGVYYAARELATAIAETVHHFEAFARDSGDPVRTEAMRVLVGEVDADFEDVGAISEPERSALLDPGSHAASQAYAGARVRPAQWASSIRASTMRAASASRRSSRRLSRSLARSDTCSTGGTACVLTAISTTRW